MMQLFNQPPIADAVLERTGPWAWYRPETSPAGTGAVLESEAAILYSMAIATRPRIIAEVGIGWIGRSLDAWIAAAAWMEEQMGVRPLIYSCDIQPAAVDRAIQDHAGDATIICGDVHEMLTHIDGQIDLAFIDGSHTREAVRNDFDAMEPWLSKRAVVIFHDATSCGDEMEEIVSELADIVIPTGRGLGIWTRST